jgi:hypothetical protein
VTDTALADTTLTEQFVAILAQRWAPTTIRSAPASRAACAMSCGEALAIRTLDDSTRWTWTDLDAHAPEFRRW